MKRATGMEGSTAVVAMSTSRRYPTFLLAPRAGAALTYWEAWRSWRDGIAPRPRWSTHREVKRSPPGSWKPSRFRPRSTPAGVCDDAASNLHTIVKGVDGSEWGNSYGRT